LKTDINYGALFSLGFNQTSPFFGKKEKAEEILDMEEKVLNEINDHTAPCLIDHFTGQ
jgi:hypothetical protein